MLLGIVPIVSSIVLILLVLLPAQAGAQSAPVNAGLQATAMRVPAASAIRLDGRLEEAAWRDASPITEFIQKEPDEGAAPSDRMEVRFVYDEGALFVGARMYSEAGSSGIQAPLSRRDEVDQAEYVLVALDTYLDRRTAYCFGVTASGVRLDHYHPTDSEDDTDDGFDPVWQARTQMDEEGWTAELWIPFSQLRFNETPQHVWGVNIHRRTPTRNEDDYWAPIPRTERAWSSRFGQLVGIDGIDSPRRVEVVPYFASGSTLTGQPDTRNPFDDGVNLTRNIGLDAKVGIGPSLTLDATINPDFGQVEADPAEVNLSNFETFFNERRPFFTTGSQLFGGGVNNYFYSRRIGGVPVGPPSGDYVDSPRTATILGAAKLTGRLSSGTSLGILAAVTDDEAARTFDATQGLFGGVPVAPRSMWGVTRVLQEFGRSASTAGLLFSGVHRDVAEGSPLAALLTRNAFSLSGDALLRLRGGEYEIALDAGMTHVDGDPASILRVQRGSPRYFQRPDATHVKLDPTRTSLNGGRADVSVQRRNGRHWLWSTALRVESPELEHNDTGRLGNGDGIQLRDTGITYRETQPGRFFRSYTLRSTSNNEWTFGGSRTTTTFGGEFESTLRNFWRTDVSVTRNFHGYDWQLTRGGPLMQKPHGWNWSARLRSRSGAQTAWEARYQHNSDELGGATRHVDGSLSFRPQPSWQLSVSPVYEHEINPRQYVTTLAGGRPETYGSRYVFSFIDRTTFSTQVRLNYTFKPDLNLDVYAEPFAASGRYYDFGELLAARSLFLRVYGTDATTIEATSGGGRVVHDGAAVFNISNRDFNVRSLRSNVVLRWEWRPGSTLYLVWQQDRSDSVPVGTRASLGDMFGSFGAPGTNFLAIKASFWLAR
jgi:hypothetical protein